MRYINMTNLSSPDKRRRGLSPDKRRRGLSPDKRRRGLSPDKRRRGLSPDKRRPCPSGRRGGLFERRPRPSWRDSNSGILSGYLSKGSIV
ncbi:MAG: hypothetical protein ACUZ8N_11915 [Candidatus Scalindua sp.]